MERMGPVSQGRRSDALLGLGGLVGLVAFLALHRSAVPQAAVRLEVTRHAAAAAAQQFLAAQDVATIPRRQATVFTGENVPLVFLQRTLGLKEASRWAREEVPVWAWQLRWFTPTVKEEWRVGVGVDGRIVELTHLLEEAAPGADLERDSGQALAARFVAERGWDISALDLVEASSEKREHRTDHRFTWERRGSTIAWREGNAQGGVGAVRVEVEVVGDAVGGYRHFLKVPEDFRRELERTQSVGLVLTIGALAATFLLVLAALGIAVVRHRHGDVRWRPAFALAGLVALLFVTAGVSSWPSIKYGYPTQLEWGAYIGIVGFGLLFLATLYGLWVLFSATAGETLGREVFPGSVAGWLDALRGRLRAPAIARASLRGYAVGFLVLGYLTVFYVLARRFFGAWLPAEGPYSEIFNHYLPFLAPLTISLVAASTEELTYRLFGISLVKRYLKSTALALLLPAAVWAFAHSAYPIHPVYIRGIELTIGGLIFGLAFLSYGILTCVVAHFVVDAVLIGMPLLTAGNPGYVVSGVVVMGLALLPALVAVVGRGRGSRRATAG